VLRPATFRFTTRDADLDGHEWRRRRPHANHRQSPAAPVKSPSSRRQWASRFFPESGHIHNVIPSHCRPWVDPSFGVAHLAEDGDPAGKIVGAPPDVPTVYRAGAGHQKPATEPWPTNDCIHESPNQQGVPATRPDPERSEPQPAPRGLEYPAWRTSSETTNKRNLAFPPVRPAPPWLPTVSEREHLPGKSEGIMWPGR